MDKLTSTFSHAMKQFLTFELVDLIDVLLVAAMIFYVIKFISDKRAGKLAMGICMILLLALMSEIFKLNAINYLISNIMQVGIILLVILFQPEIRSALEKLGGASHDLKLLSSKDKIAKDRRVTAISSLCEAMQDLARDYTGALVVIERTTPLGDIIKNGTVVNADIGVSLIKNIFYNKAPLHDGAMIIRNFRIHSAGCFLPLSTKDDIIKDLGTRHRAAIGMSENSDAIVIVVSEETGTISVAVDGKLRRNYDYNSLKQELIKALFDDKNEKEKNKAEISK